MFLTSLNGSSLFVMSGNFDYIQNIKILTVSTAILFILVAVFTSCMYIRVPALPGMIDQDNRNAADEKKRAYQLELQRQVCLFRIRRN